MRLYLSRRDTQSRAASAGTQDVETAAKQRRRLLRRQQRGRGCLCRRRRVPFTGQRIALRCIETHGEVERPFRCRQPVRLLVGAGALVLEIEVEGAVRVVFERIQLLTANRLRLLGAWWPSVSRLAGLILYAPRLIWREMVSLSRSASKFPLHRLKPLVAVFAYALSLYVLVLAAAYWFLGTNFIGSVALTGGIICGAGALIGATLTIHKDKSS